MKYTTITDISLSDKDLDAIKKVIQLLDVIDTKLFGYSDTYKGSYWTSKDLQALRTLVYGERSVSEDEFIAHRGNFKMFKDHIHYDKEA